MATPPAEVQRYGQSIWYDNIRRSLITSGELKRLIDEDGIVGVTSNPTIFQKAIGTSNDYDDAFQTMLDLDANTIYERLAISDIQQALDLLRPVYERTGGRDGFVSLEVSPLIANDTATTIAEAKRLHTTVNRPNVMIKIPSTEAGIPAIEACIAAGININVTLIFGVENYEQVAEAYIRGLERRHADGEEISQIASVASFFLSRIDTLVDKMLDNNIRAAQGRDVGRVALNNKLKGKTAIANAKIAYKRFKTIFYGERFAAMREAGAQVQRVLWASTGVKNPAYADTLYSDSLIGRDTVNTLPPDALTAFKERGTVKSATLEEGLEDAEQTLKSLADVGINLQAVTNRLQVDGVEAFAESFQSLIEQVDAKRYVLQTGVMRRMETALGGHSQEVGSAIQELEAQFANARLWAHDGTLWKDRPIVAARIGAALGWLSPLEALDFERLQALQASVKGNFEAIVLIGIGGSGEPGAMFARSLGSATGFPIFYALNTLDPDAIALLEAQIDLDKTVFVVASKGGKTFETMALFQYFFKRTGENGSRFIAITAPETPLDKIARENDFSEVFADTRDRLGSYSALGYAGFVPAALIGADLDRLRGEVETMIHACGEKIISKDHPGITLGAIMATLGGKGQDKLTILTSPSLAPFADWISHILAESTGKEGRSLLPVTGAAPGKPQDYATDRLFVYLRLDGEQNDELDSGVAALKGAGHPLITLHLPDVYAVAGEVFRWQFASATAAKLLNVNPFEQQNITETREFAQRLLGQAAETGNLQPKTPLAKQDGVALFADSSYAETLHEMCAHYNFPADSVTGLLAAQMNGTFAGDFFAFLVFLPKTDPINADLEQIRLHLRRATRRAITINYGPQYLHTMGQLYKGSGKNGVFIVLTSQKTHELAIAGAADEFALKHRALALGDVQALQAHGYRVLHLHMTDVNVGLQLVADAVALVSERKQ
jgi:transaldolase/glucose-6-phosphate isomerase